MTAEGTPYAGPAPAATARDAVAAPRRIAVRPALGPSLLAGDVAALAVGGMLGGAPWGVGALGVVVTATLARLRDRATADVEGRRGRAHVTRHHPLSRTHAGVQRLYQDLLAADRSEVLV